MRQARYEITHSDAKWHAPKRVRLLQARNPAAHQVEVVLAAHQVAKWVWENETR